MIPLTVNIPTSASDQKIYKAKVTFLGISKKDPHYDKQKRFTVNNNGYMVEDGKECLLPEEAYNALSDAMSYKAVPKSKNQAQEGVDHGDPDDKYDRIEDRRYDLTKLAEYRVAVENGKKYLVEEGKNPEAVKEAQRVAKEEMRKELEKEIEAEVRARLKAEMEAIPEATDDSEIEDLLEDKE